MTLQVNPAFTVEARLLAPVDGDVRRSHFVLRDDPEIAAWLLTVLDFILFRLGQLPGEQRIAAPPGGPLLERLVAGGVVLWEARPDGTTGLRLNPGFEVGLWFAVRVPGEPARTATVTLAAEPELCRWLLTSAVAPLPSAQPPPGPLADALRRHGLLAEQLPPPDAVFPEPGGPVPAEAVLATAQAVLVQPAGAPVPDGVRPLLGRKTPRLSAAVDLWWVTDAGSGLVTPVVATEPARAPAVPGPAAGARRAAWERQRRAARDQLATRRFAILREILAPGVRAALRYYVRQLVARGYFPALGDGQVELRSAIHNEPTVASLHQGLALIVSGIAGETVRASYCYLSCYEAGAVLAPHVDRPQCNYNLSLVLDMQGPAGEPDPWPIYLELDGRPEAVLLQVGDGLVYSGTELLHWREALPAGQRAIVCFFHFVPLEFTGSLD
jgi:hypothetical protein